jgi:hypothetical protein
MKSILLVVLYSFCLPCGALERRAFEIGRNFSSFSIQNAYFSL